MKLKTLLVTVALLAGLSAVAFILNRPAEPKQSDPRVGSSLVEASAIEKTARIKLADQGKSVELVKLADGTWQVPSYHEFPADFSKLSQFVDDLQKAKVERFVTANADRIARFEFKDTKIALLDKDGKELWSVTLGKNAEGGGRLLQFAGDKKAYLTRYSGYLDMEARNWADASLVNLKIDDIAQVELGFPEGGALVAKRAKKEDSFAAEKAPEGQKLKADRITSLLSSVLSLRFSDTSATDDANALEAKKNARTLKLTTFDGKSSTIVLGRKPEQKIVKQPEPVKDPAKAGPAAALAKIAGDKKPESKPAEDAEAKPAEGPKALEPVTETVPAGPVYAFVTSSDAKAPINGLMQKRAFQIYEYTFTSLPQKVDELFEPAPAPAPAAQAPAPAAKVPAKK